jgi:MarR family transcriptional regulator, 2-MHQ and catechol-resistance regulon repressor
MLKAMRALTHYAAAGIEGTGLGDSDFRVLEVLLHKRPLPVNTIGPIVDLTPGFDQHLPWTVSSRKAC